MKTSHPELETIALERISESVTIATLNRPDSANAIDTQMTADLATVVDLVRFDAQTAVLIVTGAGRHFCAGADLKERDRPESWLWQARRAIDALAEAEPVTIAAINGSCMGGGLELALACDIRLAARTAKLGLPEISLGVLPAAGGPQRLARLVGPSRTKILVMSAARLTAAEALEIGIVDEVAEDANLAERARELAEAIGIHARHALRTVKTTIDRGLDTSLGAALAFEYRAIDAMVGTDRAQVQPHQATQRSKTYGKIPSATGGRS